MTVGERIKELRMKLGISQVDFADKMNVSKQTLYKYENNIITNIPTDKIEKAAKIGNVSPGYLMGWEEFNSDTSILYDIFDELLADTDWSYESYSVCNEIYNKNSNCILSDDEKISRWTNKINFKCCEDCPYNSSYYYLTDGEKYYEFTKDEFNKLVLCLKPYLLFRINEAINQKNAITAYEYEIIADKRLNDELDEAYKIIEIINKNNIKITDKIRKHGDDIVNDEDF